MVEVPLDASALPARAPAEAWAHLALYRARPDAMSVARAQPESGFAAAATGISLPPVYGQVAWLGETILVHGGAHLHRQPMAVGWAPDTRDPAGALRRW